MSKFRYSFQHYDSKKHVKASLREKGISHKHAREIAITIKGLQVDKAKEYLNSVITKKRAVPFKRYNKHVGHRSDPMIMSGRYPRKSATEIIKLLENLEANAEYKGMDLDKLKIINATVHKGTCIKRFIPRAMGRSSPNNNFLTHVELVAQEL